MVRLIVLAAVAFGIGACSSATGWSTSETALLQSNTIAPDRFPPPVPVYCYRTLAEVDCHAQPLMDEYGRLVGYYPD